MGFAEVMSLDDKIAYWRGIAGHDDYGHPPLEECDQPCVACIGDERAAGIMNDILDALVAQHALAKRLAVELQAKKA